MTAVQVWLVVWRAGILVLSVVGLTLLLMDVWHRRRLGFRARFYWESMFLFLLVYVLSSIANIAHPPPDFSPVRTTLGTLALVYFLISILRVRRDTTAEEHQGHGLE